MFLVTIVVSKTVKKGIVDEVGRSGIQYHKVHVNGFGESQSTRPIISNGSGLRQAFDETSEDEV